MNKSAALAILFLLVAPALWGLTPANAAITEVQNNSNSPAGPGNCLNSSTTCSLTFTGAVTKGNIIIVSEETCDSGNNPQFLSVSDTGGDVFTVVVTAYTGLVADTPDIYCGAGTAWALVNTAEGPATEVVTVTLSTQPGGGLAGGWSIAISEWSGVSTSSIVGVSGVCASFGAGVCGTTASTSSTTFDSGDLLYGWAEPYSGASGVGSTFTDAYSGICASVAARNPCGEYKIPGSSGSTTFPVSLKGAGNKPWVATGLVIGPGTIIATAIVACTFFELQCWWYPLLFMALYSGMLLMVAHWVKASPKGKAHIFMSALTYGSLIAVILGIMNIVFPLLMLILNTIIVLRLRGS